ncbi:hypothetical protein FJ872_19515 [Mesorhizobium sp. B2-5-9]|uniref:hypothetical protein n=1 Tax=Mesorhizobium sp. B2-5-9 TaxID=2589921 RepID=UPI001125DF33|nr:hypothetical protein [Mesorhizobium sp. B2-5-9]TPK15186.1 hypothetical protein FJ872_19515 [Mesorhizobium sp. B2-5-9]
MNKPHNGPGFGKPGSIDGQRLFKLPLPMQAEGVRLLFEMGQTMDQVRERVGISARAINELLHTSTTFKRGGDVNVVAEGV